MHRYIDADELKRKALGLGEDVVCDDCTYEFINLIDDAPTIEAEPVKRGRWIRLEHDTFSCNLCGTTFILMQGISKMNCCPNCMARMERVE